MEYGGMILVVDEPARVRLYEDDLECRGGFSDALSLQDWHPKSIEICLISMGGHALTHVALAIRGRKVVTGKCSVSFTRITPLGETPLDTLIELISAPLRRYAYRSSTGTGGRVPPATWRALLGALKELHPDCAATLDSFDEARRPHPVRDPSDSFEMYSYERDSVGLALTMAGIDRTRLMLAGIPSEDPEQAPFLRSIRASLLGEDAMIQHDSGVFHDWAHSLTDVVGAAQFKDRASNRCLTVYNCNRLPLEHTHGVDLIYYHHKYKAYVLIQYKRMVQDSGVGWAFRPAGSYEAERMKMTNHNRAHGVMQPPASAPSEFRLHPGAFYFKLCEAAHQDPSPSGLLQGLYFPLDLWNLIIQDPSSLGPRGGLRVGPQTVDRYMTTTMFVDLVKAGWIGSSTTVTDLITLTVRLAEEGKDVMLAVSGAADQHGE